MATISLFKAYTSMRNVKVWALVNVNIHRKDLDNSFVYWATMFLIH